MPLIDDNDLVQINLPTEGEWVKVKRQLSGGDRSAVKRGLFAGAKMDFATEAIGDIDAAQAMDVSDWLTLERTVKEWSFDAPVTPENLRRMDIESLDDLIEQLNELYPDAKSKAETAPLDEPGPTPIAPDPPASFHAS